MMRSFDESSPAVQSHLGILQGAISRMAASSAGVKALGITLVAALITLVGDGGNPRLLFLALVPTLFLMLLDAYYLALEQGFRRAYRSFVARLHNGQLVPGDLYQVAAPEVRRAFPHALLSFAVWPFYLMMAAMIGAAHFLMS